MDQQLQIIYDLKEKKKQLQDELDDVKSQLEKEQRALQKICIHDYMEESDGDYHRPSYYYICRICDHCVH
jgi:hypothetical protein